MAALNLNKQLRHLSPSATNNEFDTQPGTVEATLLGERLLDCVSHLSRTMLDRLSPFRLSAARIQVLDILIEHGPMRQSALSQRRGIAPRTVTALVNVLERDGLVRRELDSTNRVARLLRVTDAGRDACAAAQSCREEAWNGIFGALSPRERVWLRQVIERLDMRTAASQSSHSSDEP